VEAGIGRLVLGARHDGMRKYGDAWLATPGGYGDYAVEALLDLTNLELDVVTGVRTHECEQLRGRVAALSRGRGCEPRLAYPPHPARTTAGQTP